MFLEIATTMGALSGALFAPRVAVNGLAIVFGLVLLYSAYLSGHRSLDTTENTVSSRSAVALRLDSSYPSLTGRQSYRIQGVPAGFGLMYAGLLGIGSGAVKVLAMDRVMRLPFKVSTATSNFMIGVTAAASAGVYLHRGYIDPGLAMPVVLDVLLGSVQGARVLETAKTPLLRTIFVWVIAALALEMLFDGFRGAL
jgi:uncharacterized protein